jgi:hypothetical protein
MSITQAPNAQFTYSWALWEAYSEGYPIQLWYGYKLTHKLCWSLKYSLLGFEHWDLLTNHVASINKKTFLQLELAWWWMFPLHFFFTSWGFPHVLLLWHHLLEVVTWDTSHRMINFYSQSPSHFISWFSKDWHFEICDSSCLSLIPWI